MAQNQKSSETAMAIDRLATQLAKDPQSKAFMPLAEEYGKVGMWQEAAGVLEDGLKYYPGFITAMVALGRAYDQMGQPTKAKAILEESIKLSPENLRAHRTLIKIYASQGQTDSALQSCAVILAVNPKDEEARSVQSTLGRRSKQESERPKPSAPLELNDSTTKTTVPPSPSSLLPGEHCALATSPIIHGRELMETALHEQAQTSERLVIPEPQATNAQATPPPSPHAGVVVQLEAWLRTIESRRRDRDTTNRPHSKTSQ